MNKMIALVPAKAFSRAKTRAQGNGDALSRGLLAHVVTTLKAASAVDAVWVVGPEEVLPVAESLGGIGLKEVGQGLNAAVNQGLAAVGSGVPRLVVMADLPLLGVNDVELLATRGDASVVLCPSWRGTGTNGLYLAPDVLEWRSCFEGTGSLEAHRGQAKALGLATQIEPLPGFLLDIDTPEDIEWARRLGWQAAIGQG